MLATQAAARFTACSAAGHSLALLLPLLPLALLRGRPSSPAALPARLTTFMREACLKVTLVLATACSGTASMRNLQAGGGCGGVSVGCVVLWGQCQAARLELSTSMCAPCIAVQA